MKVELPHGIKLTPKDRVRLLPHLANWLKAHAYLRTLAPDEAGVVEAHRLLALEFHTKRRMHMVHRIYGRFSRLRAQYEAMRLFK